MPASPEAPLPMVQLCHTLPDGTSHVDWMLAQDAEGREPLVTFRAGVRIDELKDGATLSLQRVADHRPLYLTYEGAVSDDRGAVRRIAGGLIIGWTSTDDTWTLRVVWEDRWPAPLRQTLRVRHDRGDAWSVSAGAATG